MAEIIKLENLQNRLFKNEIDGIIYQLQKSKGLFDTAPELACEMLFDTSTILSDLGSRGLDFVLRTYYEGG